MSSPFLGEIRIFTYNFAPRGWADCNGQLLSISQNTALFSLLGTSYGGNGTTIFALPNFQGRVPIHTTDHTGSQPFGSFPLGAVGGATAVTLLQTQLPQHVHSLQATTAPATLRGAAGAIAATASDATPYSPALNNTMEPSSISVAGGGQPHNNLQPYLALRFCIALEGIYPTRN